MPNLDTIRGLFTSIEAMSIQELSALADEMHKTGSWCMDIQEHYLHSAVREMIKALIERKLKSLKR